MNNEQTLLNCALELFSKKGYDGTGVQEICEAGGVTKPTLYHYFGSKEGILAALLSRDALPLLRDLRQATHYSGDLTETLEQTVRFYLRFAEGNRVLYRLLLSSYLAPPQSEAYKLVADYYVKQQALLELLFREAVMQHGNLRDKERRYATTLLGMVNTYISLMLAGELRLEPELVQDIVRQFSYGIYSG